MDESWSEQRRKNAEIKARQLEEAQAAESRIAAAHLQQFVRAANAEGVAPTRLETRSGDGKRKAKTDLEGWYVKADKSMAVDKDGKFYLLTGPVSLKDMLVGTRPKPSEPPLILGKGGRDGEQIDLVDALTKVVPNWRAH